jgi:hypothetical protein
MKVTRLVFALLLIGSTCLAQLTGPTSVTAGSTVQYIYYGTVVSSAYSWTISPSNGYVVSHSRSGYNYYASVNWTNAGSSTLSFRVAPGQPWVNMTVSITCPTLNIPSTTLSVSGSSCGPRTLTYSGSPPAGVNWYWQTGTGGQDTSNPVSYQVYSSGYYYLRARSNCNSTWSSALSAGYITYNPLPGTPTPTTSTTSLCGTGTVILYGTGNGANEVIRWYNVPSGGSPISTYQPNISSTTTFYASIYNSSSTCEGSRAAITVYVTTIPGSAGGSASPSAFCGSGTTTLSGSGAAGGEAYRWYDVSSGGIPISESQTVNSTTTFYVSRYNTSSYCEGARTPVTVTVYTLPTASAGNQTICSGQTTSIGITNPNGIPGTTYGWSVVTSNVTGATSGSGSSIAQTLTNSTSADGTATYTISPFANGCGGPSIVVTVTVKPLPTAAASAQTICSGQASSVTITNPNGISGTTFSWTVSMSNVTGATSGSGSSINQTLTNLTTVNGTATYTITPTANGCVGPTTNVVVTVKPRPNATASPQTICSGFTTNIPISGLSGSSYTWTAVASNVSGAGSGSGTTIAQALTSSSGGTVTYTITPSANGCTGPTSTVVATVQNVTTTPTFTGNFRFGSGTLTLTGVGAPTGGSYKWYNSANVYLSTGANSLPTAVITTTTSNYMYVSATNPLGCEGPKVPITINIYAQPTVSAPQSFITREVPPVTLTATAGYGLYTWKNSANQTLYSGPLNTYNATLPDTYNVTVTHNGASSLAIPFTLTPLNYTGQNLNYVVSNDVLVSGITDPVQVGNLAAEKVSQSITYFDGLGRPMQSVASQASPLKNDIVTPVKYDQYGRQAKQYLAFVSENTGRFKSTDLTTQASFYSTPNTYNSKIKFDAAPWAETAFEASPLNRALQKGAAGSVWQPNIVTPTNAKALKLEYKTNVDGTGTNQEKVKIWTLTPVTLNSKPEFILSSVASYPSGTLYINVTKDEEKPRSA